MSALADQYEKRYPEALTDVSQKEERMQRILLKERQRDHWRTGDQYFVFSKLPVDENGRLRP